MSLSAAVVSADLADAALETTTLTRARKLARWLGPGRELTSQGVLRSAAAAEACWALGISPPGARPPSELDVDELMEDWTAAVDAGFVVIDGRRARAAYALVASPDLEAALNAWARAAARAIGLPDAPCPGCIAVLYALHAADGPLGREDLGDAVTASEPAMPDGKPCPDCGCFHVPDDLLSVGALADGEAGARSGAEHAEETVATLVGLGAVTAATGTAPDNTVRLTPLGSMLAVSVFEGCAPAPDADAGTLMAVIRKVPPPAALAMARPWLGARPADGAVRELLALAESSDGEQRAAALAFAGRLGPEAAPAWREWAGRPGFGAYARRWLADQAEPVAVDSADEAWLMVDALSIMLAALPAVEPAGLLDAVLQLDADHEVPEALTLLRGCGHPAAASVVARLTGQPELVPVPAGAARLASPPRSSGSPATGPCGWLATRWGLAPVWLSRPD
jgi:hypothetical protein